MNIAKPEDLIVSIITKIAANVTMIHAAIIVLEEGIVTLKHVFTIFPSATYHTINAKRRLLQMPLVAIRLQYTKELYLMEKVDGLDYEKLVKFLNSQCSIHQRGGYLERN